MVIANLKQKVVRTVKFRGDYTKWQNFINGFKAAIHSSATLSNIGKFNCLRCYGAKNTLNTIERLALPMTAT